MSVDPTQLVVFDKSIVLSNSGEIQDSIGTKGQIRFNQTNLKFEGYHSTSGADIFGNIWRPLTQDVASTSNLGIFRVGNNLLINPSTGVLSSIASGSGRIKQLVITVSPILGSADYQSINNAISNAIGTPAGGYLDGSLTSELGSAPSPIYPFVIQLAPGQYSETLNQIVLPDYVSLRGEENYNSVINQYAGNININTGSILVLGQNSEIHNLVVNLADSTSSSVSSAILSLNKSNVVIDSCIFTCNTNITTTSNTYSIFMNSGNNNKIINCEFLINSTTFIGNFRGINIINSTPRIINNKIDILTPNATLAIGIYLNNCNYTESIMDKTYIENLTLSNNYKNTIQSLTKTNIGLLLNGSHVIVKNSDIEVSNIPTQNNNYGIQFESTVPLIESISSNVVSFVNTPGSGSGSNSTNTIHSSNISSVNFVTLGFQHGQYISISGSSNNDSLYRISSVPSATQILLDTGFQVITESATISNTITIKALYDVDIQNSKINSSNIALQNNDNNSNYLFNLNNLVSLGNISISPSFTYNTNYKTFTVGKVNCNFTSLGSALNSISDNSSNNRYLIKIESGIYQEDDYVTCKPYVNVEGNGPDNTTLLFYQSSNTNGIATSNSSCILLCSNIILSDFTINNSSTGNEIGQMASTILYNPFPITNLTLENIKINSICNSYWNFGVYLDSAINNIVFRNIYTNIYSNIASNANTGIYNKNCSGVSYYNVTSNVVSPNSSYNYAINIIDSECNIYQSILICNSGLINNVGLNTDNTDVIQKLVQIYGGQIRASDSIDYSVYADNYYTIICNGVQLLGDTHTNIIESRIFCSGCYTFNNETDKLNIQSLNSRGEKEQTSYNTLTIGDTAGKLNSIGTNNLIVGVNAGSNVTTASYSTFLGTNAGKSITTANNNVLIGSNAGESITSGSFNTITGSNAGINITTGIRNVINGYNTGNSLTLGNQNTLIGTENGNSLSTGNLNVFVGQYAGSNTTIANTNTFVGSSSGSTNQIGNDNTYLGFKTGNNNISGSDNVLIGREAGYTNLSNGIVSVGNYSGYSNSTATKNTYLGTESGYNTTTGDGNTFVGNESGYSTASSSGSFNTAIGNEAGHSITTGSRNVLMGSTTSSNGITNDSAGWSLTSGNDNVHIGVSAGNKATSAINNVLIGSSVGTSITTASHNVLIGENTGNTLTTNGQSVIIGTNAGNVYNAGNGLIVGYKAGSGYTGSEAFALGYQAGSNITGDFNMFMGYNSGGLPKVNTTGAYNIAIGPYTGYNLSSGTRNVIIGSGDSGGSAGKLISTGSDNTLVGYKAGGAIQTGVGNTLLGSNAGPNLTSGQDNLVLGYQSGFNLNSGSYNVVLGPQAGYSLNNGQGNIYSGYQSGYNNSTGSYNINMGYQSGYTSTGNEYNIHIGHKSGYKSSANNNLFLGYQSGLNNTFGTNNIFIGVEAGAGVNSNSKQVGENNIFLGTHSGYSNDTGYSNIYMGAQAGESSIDGSKNIFIGENAGSLGSTSHNIFIGNASSNTAGIGYKSNNTGQYNVFIGNDVGIENTLGQNNIFLGDKAGMNNVTGIENIYIGTNAGKNANNLNANYNIAIGSDAGINNLSGKENILLGRQVAGLVTSTNYNQNIIIGTDAGQYIQQNNQIFIGTNAGQNNTTGDRNIFIGLNSGKSNINSPDNIVIGSDAGVSLTGSGGIGDNVIIGSQAGHDLETGTNNIYIGSSSGASATTSINNVVIGANAMLSGNANNLVIIGKNAGQSNAADASIFIGSNAGVQNTTGLGNIFVGYEAGYAVTNSNGNIIFGNQASSTGRIADNNIILGNQTASNVVNKANFANNIVMGADAGRNTNLAISSIMIGSNSVGLGTGGDVNIIMGNNTAVHLGDQHNYYATTLTSMSINNSNVTINIPFGTGSYYFNYGDSIIIESLNNEYVFQTQVSAIIIDTRNSGNNGKTELILRDKPTQTIPSGSVLYVKNVKQPEIGPTDYSKSSSNMCIGDKSGYDLTTGSKNAAIGDSAMYQNKIGRYNIAFGTEAGYSLNTDNNLCLGIKAGYSLDSYKDTSVVNDFTFYQSNNTITSNSQDFTVYPYGTQFDISGSSSNDARYNVNDVTSNSIIVQGFPNITNNGLPDNVYPSFFTIGSSQFAYTNYTYTGNISFNYFDAPGETYINLKYNNQLIAQNAYNTIQYISHFTISNSQFNNNVYSVYRAFNRGVILDNSNININVYFSVYPEISSNSTISINNISSIKTIINNSFNCNIFGNDNINVQFSFYRGVYNTNADFPYQKQSTNTGIISNGIIVDNILKTGIDYINNIYIQGNTTNIISLNCALTNEFRFPYISGTVVFDSITNTITNASTSNINKNIFVKISGTQYNNGYYYITSFTLSSIVTLYIDKNFPLINETFNTTIDKFITYKYCNFINAIKYNDVYKSNADYKGNILKIKYTKSFYGNSYDNYHFGSYVLEKYYNNVMGLSSNIVFNNSYYDGTPTEISICDSGVKVKANDFIDSNDLIFQTSNNSFNNYVFATSFLTTPIDYEFVDIVAPVIIKIEGSLYNNGFYLVTQNDNPFTTLTINGNFTYEISSGTSNITIKTKCISSFLGIIDLTYLQFNKKYTIFGSKYNDNKEFSLYNNLSCLSNSSVYLSDSTTIVNDSYNDVLAPILSGNSSYSAFGFFQNIKINKNVTFYDDSTIQITATGLDGSILDQIQNNTYINLLNTSIGFDGLYYITSKSMLSAVFTFTISNSFIRNNTVYNTPPFTPVPGTPINCDILLNQFINDNTILYAFNFNQFKLTYGSNTKFLSFYDVSTAIQSVNTKNQNTLTFEISSYRLNLSTFAVALTENCPSQLNTNNRMYIIQFGPPNPSTRISNIQRKPNRPIFYTTTTDTTTGYSNFRILVGYTTFTTSNNSITISKTDTIPTTIRYQNHVNSFYYNTNITNNDFRLFKKNQFINIFGSNFNNKNYLVKSVSSDFNTLFLDDSFNTVIDETLYNAGGGLFINLQKIINNLPFKCGEILVNPSFLSSIILIKKNYNLNYYTDGTGGDILSDSAVQIINSSISAKTSSSLLCDPLFFSPIMNNYRYFSSLCMPHTMLIPSSNLIYNNTNISFHNYTSIGSSDISFYSSNNTITSTSTNLSSFLTSEYIFVSGTTNNNYLYRINDTVAPTTNKIIISTEYTLVNEINKSATLKANNINTSNISLTDLSVFSGGQVLIVSRTTNNNTNYTSKFESKSPYSIYINSTDVITETPQYCVIEKSMLINETSKITGVSDIDFSGSSITVTDNLIDLSLLRTGQQLAITGTSYNNTNVTISNSIIPSNISITTDNILVNEINTSASLTKQIDFTVIGTPLQALTTTGYTQLYHYEDAEGNNAMIGSFAGQYVGALNNAIYNVAIGSRCGQVNHGSGNIFIGNESQLATTATQGATTFSNKFAVYKNNFIGVTSVPLIGGDFTSGRVGINTINPESFTLSSDVTSTATKLVVNGGAIANSFSPFTGCHLVNFDTSNISIADNTSNTSNTTITNINVSVENYVIPGMIMTSTGVVQISSIVSTFLTVKPSSIINDKCVFGVYAYSDESKASTESEYIIDSNEKYVKNLGYTNEMVKLNYVAALGEGCILVSNYSGEIQNGDYITTCPIAGYGALQSDDILHSYTVAKCTQSIDWSSISNNITGNDGIQYKTVMVSCTYHCG